MAEPKIMTDPIVTRQIGGSTWQGPESEAPDVPLPIDLPAIEDHEVPSPLQSIKARDLIYIAVSFVAVCAPALTLWVLS